MRELGRLASSLRGVLPSAVRARLRREAQRFLRASAPSHGRAVERFRAVLWEELDEASHAVAAAWDAAGDAQSRPFRDAVELVSKPEGRLDEIARLLVQEGSVR